MLISILKPDHQSMNLINTTSHLNIIYWSMSYYSFITDDKQTPNMEYNYKQLKQIPIKDTCWGHMV